MKTDFFELLDSERYGNTLNPTDLLALQIARLNKADKIKHTIVPAYTLINSAQNTPYDNTTSGLTSENVQEAIDELVSNSGSGGSEYTETIVDISSAQILAMGTTPIELLPASGVGMYYDIGKIIIEKDTFSTPYDLGTSEYIGVKNTGSGTVTVVHKAVLTNNSTQTAFLLNNFNTNNLDFGGTLFETNRNVTLNSGYILTTNDWTNPTNGDGTLRVKIYHKTLTFGA